MRGPRIAGLLVAIASAILTTGGVAVAGVTTSPGPTLVGAWTPEERAQVEAVVRRLPPALVARAPSVVVRDRGDCEPDGLPADEDLLDARGVAHLCVPRRDRAAADLGRQVALALVFGFDRAVRWSEDPGWRRINGWQRSIAHPLNPRPDNVHEAAFAAPWGSRSPRWDLASVVVAMILDEPNADDGVACRLLAQAAFVRRRIAEIGGPNDVRAVSRTCSAFERWADLDRLADVEVVLATPSTAMAASLFGHVLLRLVYRDDDGTTPLHMSQTVAFLADNEVPFEADRAYALKGIVGVYTASLHERPFLDAYREYVVLEGRDLRRWRLNLTSAERRDLMERLWTAERAYRVPYYFFRRNCATLMLELVDQTRPTGLLSEAPGLLAAPPASLLEPLARASGVDGAPLLQFVAEPLWSFDHQARLTSRQRRGAETRIVARVEGSERQALRALFDAAHASAADERAQAYRRLAAPLSAPDAGDDADVRAWLQDSATIESHLSTLANLEAEARADRERHQRLRAAVVALLAGARADVARLRARDTAGADSLAHALLDVEAADADRRLLGYRGLLAFVQSAAGAGEEEACRRARLLALLQSEARYDVSRMKRAPGGLRDALLFPDLQRTIDEQAYVSGHEELIRVPVETRVSAALRSLQQTRRSLFVARGLDGDSGSEGRDAGAAAGLIRGESHEYDGALSRSGIDQLGALAAVAIDGGGSPVGALGLSTALYDERIGDHRRLGFPSDTAMVVGRSVTFISAANGRPALHSYDARVFGYRTVRHVLPESPAGRAPLGWELYLDVSGNWARNLGAAPRLGWGVLTPVFDRRDLGDHVLFGFGVAYDAYFPVNGETGPGRLHGLALPVALEARWGLGAMPRHRSWIGSRLWGSPSVVGAGLPRRGAFDVGASVEAHLAMRARATSGAHDPAVLLRAQLTRSTLSFDADAARIDAVVSAGVDWR